MQAAPQSTVVGAVQGSRPNSMMSPMDAVKKCIKGSLTLEGRASRSEYWWFALFYQIVNMVMITIAGMAGIAALYGNSCARSGSNLCWCTTPSRQW